MDKYTNLKVLGEGAFGTVYKARCKDDGNKYALKRLTVYSGDSAELIQREINALRQVGRHPNIMQYIDNFIGGSRENTMAMYVWLVLEYCNGGTLDSFILSKNLDQSTTLQLLRGMAEGVAYLHGKNIVHRDLKPENILVENSGPRPIVKIADFGLARVCGQTEAGGFNINLYYMDTVAGTLYYWPPEMLRHMLAQQADQVTYNAKTDVWAMGIIIAAILDRMIDPLRPGKLKPVIPVDERAMPVAEAILSYPDFPLADMLMKTMKTQSGMKALALTMLAVDPHQRPTSEQVLLRLKQITNRTNVQDSPPMPPPAPHTVVEIPAVEGSEPDSENQTSCKDRIACCCVACWRCDSDVKFYHICGKGPGWVIVLLILWAITGAVVIPVVIVTIVVAFVFLIVCYPFYYCCCHDRHEIV